MSSYKTQVQQLRYNAANQSFEALVLLHEGGETIKYPTALKLPIDSDFTFVSHKLVDQAKKLRRQNAGHLVSRTPKGQSRLANLSDMARQFSERFRMGSDTRAA